MFSFFACFLSASSSQTGGVDDWEKYGVTLNEHDLCRKINKQEFADHYLSYWCWLRKSERGMPEKVWEPLLSAVIQGFGMWNTAVVNMLHLWLTGDILTVYWYCLCALPVLLIHFQILKSIVYSFSKKERFINGWKLLVCTNSYLQRQQVKTYCEA